ncbi:MAG TPA: regulatory protein RecX [Saprospiraceae bacterium]|nr:regulatory protein RecX [Saprospiraceae bacterium]HMQ82883.1 regulatory protein RecX [Saprospiraceae bacterium]
MKNKFTSQQALEKLQRYCAYQDRCHQEVRAKLLEMGVFGDDLEVIMVALIEEGFLNEERFARSFARGKFRIKEWGKQRIEAELRQRKISDYCIRKALEEIDETSYEETLKKILLKKKEALKTEESEVQVKSKLFRYAHSRGFESGLIGKTIGQLWDE